MSDEEFDGEMPVYEAETWPFSEGVFECDEDEMSAFFQRRTA